MINSTQFQRHAELVLKYQRLKDEINQIIKLSRISKNKKKTLEDLITDLLITQEELTIFDNYGNRTNNTRTKTE